MHRNLILNHSLGALAALVVLLGIGLVGCSGTQKVPGPLWLDDAPEAPDGSSQPKQYSPVGSVIRHSSPVWVRRPGASAGTQIAYYDKRVRVQGGAEVRVGFGGRAELLWPDRSSSVVLFNSGEARFGDQSLDEPLLTLSHLGRAQIILSGSDHVRLPGGAQLRGDGSPLCGPILVDAISGELMRVKNQSKQLCHVSFRGVPFELIGGETIDLPFLLVAESQESIALLERVLLGNYVVNVSDGLRVKFDGAQLHVAADSRGAIALGDVVVRLDAGEQAVFSGLDPVASRPSPVPASPLED